MAEKNNHYSWLLLKLHSMYYVSADSKDGQQQSVATNFLGSQKVTSNSLVLWNYLCELRDLSLKKKREAIAFLTES